MKKLLLHTETWIDSSHYLKEYIGNCKNIHGHTWHTRIWIKGYPSDTDKIGILFDFGNIKKIKEKYDHKLLNEIEPFNKINPTAENLSQTIYNELKEIRPELEFKVRVYETAVGKKTYCQWGDFE